jgi:non-lysosomal glucosylceramidase
MRSLMSRLDGLSPQCSQRLAVAVSVSVQLLPGASGEQIDFALAWDQPYVQFGRSSRVYRRFYTRYFGADSDAGDKLCDYALNEFERWHRQIDEWQAPVVKHQ